MISREPIALAMVFCEASATAAPTKLRPVSSGMILKVGSSFWMMKRPAPMETIELADQPDQVGPALIEIASILPPNVCAGP